MENTTEHSNNNVIDTRIAEHEEGMKTYRSLDKDLDQFVITLTLGVYGISFAFIEKIIPIKEASCLNLLILSWAFFTIVILSHLVSMKFSVKLHLMQTDNIIEEKHKNLESNWRQKVVKLGNEVKIWSTGIGILLLFAFCFVNLMIKRTDDNTDSRTTNVSRSIHDTIVVQKNAKQNFGEHQHSSIFADKSQSIIMSQNKPQKPSESPKPQPSIKKTERLNEGVERKRNQEPSRAPEIREKPKK